MELDLAQQTALKEYEVLREEILARIVMRDQMVNYMTGTFAAVIGLAAYTRSDTDFTSTSWILLSFPWVALAFAHGWATHDLRIFDIGSYIRIQIAKTLPALQWEQFLEQKRIDQPSRWLRRQSLFACGAFLGTSLVSMLLGVAVFLTPTLETPEIPLSVWVLVVVDVAALYFTVRIIWQRV